MRGVQDATENDIPSEPFDRSASGNVNVEYEGDRTKEDFISFIEKNKATNSHGDETTSTKIEEAKRTGESAAKDELVEALLFFSKSIRILYDAAEILRI
ncbi:hypothetical protein YC2023_091634 [Brassica napus]